MPGDSPQLKLDLSGACRSQKEASQPTSPTAPHANAVGEDDLCGPVTGEQTGPDHLARALSGAAPLGEVFFEDAASWQLADAPVFHGQNAILAQIAVLDAPQEFRILQSECHGRAASVTGIVKYRTEPRQMFCHVIKYSDASRAKIAQMVSILHPASQGIITEKTT